MEGSQSNIDEIFSLYEKYGSRDYIGEPVSQIEHMVQAAMLAEEDNQSKEIILAALFHDIGHLLGFDDENFKKMGDSGVHKHEKIGGNFLRSLDIPDPIPYLVENHVNAKRYLCYKDDNYYQDLSPASKITLGYQGGVMEEEEALSFEKTAYFNEILLLRSYDERAKKENITIKSLNYYKDLLTN